ncbi:hypothetical protein [Actinomadura sp. SCN-SB]|uniref:hypothetical protein n=1 Tax=Actinomadura sp. SCN-SB TaxID=3373092 RepID=UPI003753B13F
MEPSGEWRAQGWSAAWGSLRGGLEDSVKIAVTGSPISAMLGSLNGYVLSKWRFPGADAVFTLFLFGMFIPYQAVMIPLAGLLTDMELVGTIRAVRVGGGRRTVRPADGLGSARLTAHSAGIPAARTVLHARPDGRSPQGMTRGKRPRRAK